MSRLGLSAALSLAILGGEALSSPTTFDYEGTVSVVQDGTGMLDGSIVVGGSFSGSYTFESTTLDIDERSNVGTYPQFFPNNMSLNIGNYAASFDFVIIVGNDLPEYTHPASYDRYFVGSSENFSVPGLGVVGASIDLRAHSSTPSGGPPFASDMLPLTPPALDEFYQGGGFAGFRFGQGTLVVAGVLTCLTPEPASLLLLALGGLVVMRRR